jgi:ferritin
MPFQKVFRFKVHIQWAEKENSLEEFGKFLRSLSEDEWMHYGEL